MSPKALEPFHTLDSSKTPNFFQCKSSALGFRAFLRSPLGVRLLIFQENPKRAHTSILHSRPVTQHCRRLKALGQMWRQAWFLVDGLLPFHSWHLSKRFPSKAQ